MKDQRLRRFESERNYHNCSSCYQTETESVWTHTAKRPWRHHNNGARQERDPEARPASDGWTISGDIENMWPGQPNDGRQEGVVKDGGKGRHTLVYKTQGEKVKPVDDQWYSGRIPHCLANLHVQSLLLSDLDPFLLLMNRWFNSVCTDTSILFFGNVLNAYLNNHNIILLNIDGCEYCICRYLFVCILTWVLIKSSVCLSFIYHVPLS